MFELLLLFLFLVVAVSVYYEIIYAKGFRLPFFTFVSLYYFVFHGLFSYYAASNVPHLPFGRDIGVDAVIFTVLFVGFQFSGYFLASSFSPIQAPTALSRPTKALMFLSWMLVAGYFVIYFVLSFSSVPSLPQLKMPCWYFGFSTLIFLLFQGHLSRWHIAILILALTFKIAIDVANGFLTPIFFDFVIIIGAGLCLKRFLPLVFLCTICATLFFSYGYVKHFSREYLNGGNVEIFKFSPELSFNNLGASFDSAARRSAHFLVTSHVIKATPTVVPYEDRNPFLDAAINHVPRILWPSKPKENHGNRFGKRYGILEKKDNETSWNLPWTVDLFITFGPVISLFGIFIVGGVFGGSVRWMSSREDRPFWFGVYSATLLPLFYQESNFSVMTGSVFSVLIFLLTSYWVAKRLFPPH